MKFAIALLSVLAVSAITPIAFAQNRALSLDGKFTYMEAPPSPSLDISTELTIELWFTSDIPENDVYLLTKNGDIMGSSALYALYITSNSSRAGFHLDLKGSGAREILRSGDFTDGRWRHLAGTFDGQIMTLYMNGVKRASLALEKKDEIRTRSHPLQIGTWLARGAFHSGLIDEIRIWKVARTQEEIRATMNVALTGKEKGLAAYWNFDDGAARDLSPNSNDATLHNNARIIEHPLADVQDTTTPAVIETMPSSSENVPVDIKEIKFSFSEEMNKGWAIEYLDNLPLSGVMWSDDMKTLTLSIMQPLQPGTLYFVILNPSFTPRYVDLTGGPGFFSDTDGNLLEEFFLTFTTEKKGEVDITLPTIKEIVFFRTNQDGTLELLRSLYVEHGIWSAKEVPTDVTDIMIVFSEKMCEKGNRSLKYSDNFPRRNVNWSKGGENSMTFVTISLREPLVARSKYYIKLNVVDEKYVDLAGNLLEPYTITFATVGGSMAVSEKGCAAITWGAVRREGNREEGVGERE